MRTYDQTGRKVGRLTVIRRVGKTPDNKRTTWECKCDCGNTIILPSNKLSSGTILSCGCLRKEEARKKQPNANAQRGRADGTVMAMLKGEEPYASGSTGYRGVSYNKPLRKYTAQITFKRKKYHLGVFDNPEDAHKAYLEAKDKMHLKFLAEYSGEDDAK